MELNEKQKRFVDYYCQSGNAAQSAIKAGYSEKTARSQGQRLLTKADIISAVEIRNKELESERIADMVEIKQFWTATMRDEISEQRDRLKASEYLAKTKGAFIEKVEHSGEMTQNVNNMTNLTEEQLRKLAEMEGE